MAKTQKVRLIAAATAFLALSLPRSSSAQFFPPFFPSPPIGTWTGYESFETSVYDLYAGKLVNSYSGSGTATLYIGLDYMYIFGPGKVAVAQAS